MALYDRVQKFDEKVAVHREKGTGPLVASVKVCREMAKERKQSKGGKR